MERRTNKRGAWKVNSLLERLIDLVDAIIYALDQGKQAAAPKKLNGNKGFPDVGKCQKALS